jgi:O6-methylguanine-DNA--protein-cysteine methyltransferase
MIKTTVIETPIGDMKAGATKEGLCFLAFNDTIKADSELADLARILNTEVTKGSNRHLRSMKRQLKEYFKGKRKDFPLVL